MQAPGLPSIVGKQGCAKAAQRAGAAGMVDMYMRKYDVADLLRPDAGSFERNQTFGAACAARGVYVHPHHNWFLSTAHSEADIRRTLEVTDEEVRGKTGTFAIRASQISEKIPKGIASV